MRRKVLLLNRSSVVRNGGISRSVEERLLEPLGRVGNIELTLLSEDSPYAAELTGFDSVVMNRPHTLRALDIIKSARANGVRVIIDLDDIPSLYLKGDSAYLGEEKTAAFSEALSLASLIVCSTQAIYDWVAVNNLKASKVLIRTGFDFEKIDSLKTTPVDGSDKTAVFTNTGTIKLGAFRTQWMETLGDVLQKYSWKLDVFADFLESFPANFPLRYLGSVPWLEHKSLLFQSQYPLAVAPLASSEDQNHLTYARLKTPIKYIIYGGLGIPCIYSNSPIYQDCVADRETGLLVDNNSDAWYAAVEELIVDRHLASKIRRNAIEDVRSKYDIRFSTNLWTQIFNS